MGRFRLRLYGRWMMPLALIVGSFSCGGDDSFELAGRHYRTGAVTQWALPHGLREISGLALDDRQRLFAHNDENAVIFQIDYASGRIAKRFSFGDPPARGDFEGIAWIEGLMYLVTSDGELLFGREGADGEHVAYHRTDTRLGRRCEIEGLDYDATANRLLMPCKQARERGLAHQLVVLTWSLGAQSAGPVLRAPWPAKAQALNPSGVAVAPVSGHLVLVAARQRALAELDSDGTLLSAFVLAGHHRHPQMEGIAISPAGDLLVADEGKGKRGRLSVYAPDR